MPRELKKERNLEYRLVAGTRIYHNNGMGNIRMCYYSGKGNMLLYNKELITPNKFCTSHMKETRPDKLSNRKCMVRMLYFKGAKLT